MEKSSLHILTRADVRSGNCYKQWEDPDRIAPILPEKLRTLMDNPLAGGDDEPLQIIGTQGNRVIGRIDLLAGELAVDGQPVPIFWGSHLIVPKEFRNTLMGVLLIMKAQALRTSGASGPSQLALPVYQKLKWIDLPLPRYILIVRSKPVVERYVGNPLAAAALHMLADFALRAHRLLIASWRSRRTRKLSVEKVGTAPAELDELFHSRTEPVQAHRSVAFLEWQLTHQFGPEPRNQNALYLVRDRSGKLVGYFLNKVRFHHSATHREFKDVLLGSMQDWMIFDPLAVDTKDLLMLSLRELFRAGVHAVDFCSNDPSLKTMLRLLGFVRLGAMHIIFKPSPNSPLTQARYHDLRQWWIRPGDGDNFFV